MENPVIREYKPTPQKLKKIILKRDNYTCQECGMVETHGRSFHNVQVHHKIPYRAGGEHTEENLITLCFECHIKSDKKWSIETNAWARYKDGLDKSYLAIISEY